MAPHKSVRSFEFSASSFQKCLHSSMGKCWTKFCWLPVASHAMTASSSVGYPNLTRSRPLSFANHLAQSQLLKGHTCCYHVNSICSTLDSCHQWWLHCEDFLSPSNLWHKGMRSRERRSRFPFYQLWFLYCEPRCTLHWSLWWCCACQSLYLPASRHGSLQGRRVSRPLPR